MTDVADTSAAKAESLLWQRLARTPYLVIPKLALMAMPEEWQAKMESLLAEADEAGLVTPEYHVFRDDGPRKPYTRAVVVNEQTGFIRLTGGKSDPWADYRHGNAEEKARALSDEARGYPLAA